MRTHETGHRSVAAHGVGLAVLGAFAGALIGGTATTASGQLSGFSCATAPPCGLKTKQQQICRSDFDGDGVVTQDDLDMLRRVLQQPGGPTRDDILRFDVDGVSQAGCLGRVDARDYYLASQALGEVCLCDWDINGDGAVGEKDVVWIHEVFGANSSDSCKAEFADINNDGAVDNGDLDLVLNSYGCGSNDPCQINSNCNQAGSIQHACKADYNRDGIVDDDDEAILLAVLAQPGGPTRQDVLLYDVDHNSVYPCPGVLDIEDLFLLQRVKGVECPCGGADLNGDGEVGTIDAEFLMTLWGLDTLGFCKGEYFDLDNSGFVDAGDAEIMLKNYHCGSDDPCSLSCFQPEQVGLIACRADYDRDGVVGQSDLDLLDAALNRPGGPTETDIRLYDIDANSFGQGGESCPGVLDVEDRLWLLRAWGVECECYADLDGSGVVDTSDVNFVLTLFGLSGNDGFCKAEFFDLDNSGLVDQGDLDHIRATYGCGSDDPCATDANCFSDGSNEIVCRADYDGDGIVDQDDFDLLNSIVNRFMAPPTPTEILLYDLDGGTTCDAVLDGEDLVIMFSMLGSACGCRADMNADGTVDSLDVDIVAGLYGASASSSCAAELADIDNDGTIDLDDILAVFGDVGCTY